MSSSRATENFQWFFFFPLRNQLSSKLLGMLPCSVPLGKLISTANYVSALHSGRRLHEILPFRWIEFVSNFLGFLLLLQCNDRPCLN